MITSVGGAKALGKVTSDWMGSRDAWDEYAIASLIRNYVTGVGGAGGYGDGSIGQPAPEDMGSQKPGGVPTPYSLQTAQYWENYVRRFGSADPALREMFGDPPTRTATYQDDPNSASSVYGSFKDKAAESALDRASTERISAADNDARLKAAQIDADARIKGIGMQVDSDWKIAAMNDITRRYVAEGDWGVQKYVADQNNKGAMDRLVLELGQRDRVLAQSAIAEKNRHGEELLKLSLEVAKYDSELAASPRNWLKYAAWLGKRDIIVNGLTLAMAAQEVPDNAINPADVAALSGVGALETAQEAQQAATGAGVAASPAAQAAAAQTASGPTTNLASQVQPQQQGTGPAQGANTVTPGAAETPADMAKRLLGNWGTTSAEADPANLQNIVNSLNTTGGTRSNFGGGGADPMNAQGVTIPESQGQQVDYRNFSRLLPTQQQMKAGAVESVRGAAGVTDWVKEMENSRPKGGNAVAAAWG